MTIPEQLTEIYALETWHKTRLSNEESNKYHDTLLNSGNIIVVNDGDRVVGYCEFWRLNFEQFGRIIAGEPFSATCENVQDGQIAYVANTYIMPQYRRGGATKMIKDRFMEVNKLCTHFVGEARRKSCAPVKVFKRNRVPERI